MLSIKIESIVNSLVESELIGKGRDHMGLHFQFDCNLALYRKSRIYTSGRYALHLVYYVPEGMSYVSVFSALSERFCNVNNVTNWKHEITHDSCWRTIGTFADVYFMMARQINDQLFSDNRKEVAPKDMTEHNCTPLFKGGSFYGFINVAVNRDKTDNNHYRETIQIL